jgi:bifunctional oligoribonuclease and PAP phosphatase NrnA
VSRVDWKPLVSRLRDAESIVLGTHINADGDGLGCQIALHEFLIRQGRRSVIINSEAVPEKYRFLKGSETVQAYAQREHAGVIRNAGLFVTLDNSSVERLAKVQADVQASSAFKVCIDHHAMVNPYWDLNCVDTDACASGQLVYELIRQMGGVVSAEMAEALYVSFMTDTGHFRFSKTTSETHRLVAELMDIGKISAQRFYTEVYEKTSPAMAALTGLALNSLRFEYGGRCAWMRLTREEIAACHGEEEDTGDLVNLALAVDGVIAGALFKEMPDGSIKVSLRSRGELDVNALATHFGGGGHRNASGILMPMGLKDAVKAVVGRLRESLKLVIEAPVARGGESS